MTEPSADPTPGPAIAPDVPSGKRHDGGRRAATAGGLILIGIGLLFLAGEFLPAIELSTIWPIASAILGVILVVLAFRPRRD